MAQPTSRAPNHLNAACNESSASPRGGPAAPLPPAPHTALHTLHNPDLICAVTVGDGEAETGPLATSWQSNKFLNPVGDGAVLPILHLNGYKISNPTIFGRMTHEEMESFFRRCLEAVLR